MTYQNRAPAFSIGVPTPPLLAVLTGCSNSGTARTMRRVSVLCPAPSSCRNSGTARTMRRVSVLWWAASSCRHRWFKPWCEVQPLGSTPWCEVQPRVCTLRVRRPRVAIVVQTPPRVAIHTVKIRVPAVVQTRGESNVYQLGVEPVV